MEKAIKELSLMIEKVLSEEANAASFVPIIKEWVKAHSAYVHGAFTIDQKKLVQSNTPADKIMLYELKLVALAVGEIALMECGEADIKRTSVIMNPKVDYRFSILCWKLGGVKELFRGEDGPKAGNQIHN